MSKTSQECETALTSQLRDSAFQESIGWVALSSLVCRRRRRPASVTSPLISTIWGSRPSKPYIFCKDMILAACHHHHIIIQHKTHDIFYIFGKKRTQGYQIQWHLHIMSASTVHHQYIIKVSTVQHQCINSASSAHHCFAFIAELSPVYCCLVLNCLFVFLSFVLLSFCLFVWSVSSLKCHSVFLDALASLDFTLVSE